MFGIWFLTPKAWLNKTNKGIRLHPLRMCDRCFAEQGVSATPAMNYKNFGSSEAWSLTSIDHHGYLHLHKETLTPWLAVEGFTMDTMMWDLLHNIFLGTARDLVASGLHTLVTHKCYEFLGTSDMDSILSFVDARVRKKASKYKCLVLLQGFPTTNFWVFEIFL